MVFLSQQRGGGLISPCAARAGCCLYTVSHYHRAVAPPLVTPFQVHTRHISTHQPTSTQLSSPQAGPRSPGGSNHAHPPLFRTQYVQGAR